LLDSSVKKRPSFPKAALRFQFSLPAVGHGLDAAGVGAGVGWFGLAWLPNGAMAGASAAVAQSGRAGHFGQASLPACLLTMPFYEFGSSPMSVVRNF
jgi:hypothetical protein